MYSKECLKKQVLTVRVHGQVCTLVQDRASAYSRRVDTSIVAGQSQGGSVDLFKQIGNCRHEKENAILRDPHASYQAISISR